MVHTGDCGETKIDLIKNREVPEFSREKHL